jgi:hypothetical protein
MAFLLDLWTRPSTAVTDPGRVRRLPKLRTFDSGEARTGWMRPGLRGLKYAEIVDALGAYTPCDTRFGRA